MSQRGTCGGSQDIVFHTPRPGPLAGVTAQRGAASMRAACAARSALARVRVGVGVGVGVRVRVRIRVRVRKRVRALFRVRVRAPGFTLAAATLTSYTRRAAVACPWAS